ncbi:MAG: long-chain fatty acid--CoA ligase [Saprospiraceae bacterium]
MRDWVAKWAIYSPNKIAIKEFESQKTITYRALDQRANQMAHYLAATYQIGHGDRVAVLAMNCIEYIVLFAAAQKNGMILVPLNYRLASAEIQYLINTADPKLLIIASDFQEASANIPDIDHLMQISLSDLNLAINPFSKKAFKGPKIQEEDPIFLLFTSGTTGFPKGAIYTHKMLFWNSINTAMSLLINTESRTINCMPPFHTGGWNVLLTPFLHHGGYTCLMQKFDADAVLSLMETEHPTLFMGVPTMLKMIAAENAFERSDLSSLNYIIVGGEPMPIPLIERWHQKGVYIRQGFGMTEVGPNLTSLHQEDAIRKKGSIGRPNFYVETKIVDPKGQPVPANVPGELLFKSPVVTPGYWRDSQATTKTIQAGWFHSGDMAKQDEEGYLYIVDRIKNMFISGGENVYPAEIERVLATHQDINSVVVIPMPDSKWGEVGHAIIVAQSGVSISETEILAYCQGKLAKFKIPKRISFVKELPVSATGKINRKQLAAEYS